MTIDDRLRSAAADLLEEVRATTDPEAALDRLGSTTPSRGARRPARWMAVAAAAAVVVVAAAVVLVGAGADEGEELATDPTTTAPVSSTTTADPAAGLAVTVSPSTDLVEGQEVVVAGTGFPSDGSVAVVMCVADALSSGAGDAGCDLSQAGSAVVHPDGRVDGTIVLRRTIVTASSGWVDCAAGEVACAVAVGQVEDHAVAALAPVAFAPQPAIAPLTLAASPAEGLQHGQTVTMTIDGVGDLDESLVMFQQCANGAPDAGAAPYSGGPPCLMGNLGRPGEAPGVSLDASGRLTAEVTVWRTIPDGDPPVDCADVGCYLRIDVAGRSATAPLAFDGSASAPPVPTMTAAPTSGLQVGDEVVVTVEGLAPGTTIEVFGCGQLMAGATIEDGCPPAASLGLATADGDGRVVVAVTAPDPSLYGVTCARPGQCGLTFFTSFGGPGGTDPTIRPTAPVAITYGP